MLERPHASSLVVYVALFDIDMKASTYKSIEERLTILS